MLYFTTPARNKVSSNFGPLLHLRCGELSAFSCSGAEIGLGYGGRRREKLPACNTGPDHSYLNELECFKFWSEWSANPQVSGRSGKTEHWEKSIMGIIVMRRGAAWRDREGKGARFGFERGAMELNVNDRR